MKKMFWKDASLLFLLGFGMLTFTMSSCSEEKCDCGPDEEEQLLLPPIALDCDYFTQDRVLVNDPDRPVDYLIDCYMKIGGDVQIQIEPGVVIAFEADAGMNFRDVVRFEALGTPDEPIVFTGTSANKGHWRGLIFYSSNSNTKLQHTVIEYAGGKAFTEMSPHYEGSVAVAHDARVAFDHLTVRDGGTHGLQLNGGNSEVSTSALLVTGNEGVPVKISAYHTHILDATSSFSGNASDFINVVSEYYAIEQTARWNKLDVPYLVDGRVHVKNGGHLSIEAGVELQFKSSAYLQAGDMLPYDYSIRIEGSPSAPVFLTAANGSNWGGIYFSFTQEDNVIANAVIEYAKGDFPVGNLSNSGAIYMHANPKIAISNTTFQHLPNYALYAYTGAGTNRPDLPNLSLDSNSFVNVAKGNEEDSHLGWGNGSGVSYP